MLRWTKIGLLAAANTTGLNRLIGDSAWRHRRLLILCYHGVTDGDLHQWNPSMFMRSEDFKRRLDLLRSAQCNVLGLGEALRRLEDGSLPERSVVLTFDDGFADFYRLAWPVLREYGFPATLYLTTYYVVRELPVFDLALDYLLWKGVGRRLNWPEIVASPVSLDLAGRERMRQVLQTYALKKELTAPQKDDLLEDLAKRLDFDYGAIRQSRVLNLINPEEARTVSAGGVDLQLHTHRHRTSNHQDGFSREIVENRDCVAALGLHFPEHFCYPNGVQRTKDPRWLEKLGIKSSVTCEPGLVAPGSECHSLARVVDSSFTEVEFLGWLHGTAAFLPRRRRSHDTVADREAELAPLLQL